MAGALVEVRVQGFPDCWESCGNCRSDELQVVELQVAPGDRVELYTPLLVLEALKTEIEVASPVRGRVARILVREGDWVGEAEPLLLIAADA